MTTKQEFLDRGWKSIGFSKPLEYLAREDEHGSIQYIPVLNDTALGHTLSLNKELIGPLNNFVNESKKESDV